VEEKAMDASLRWHDGYGVASGQAAFDFQGSIAAVAALVRSLSRRAVNCPEQKKTTSDDNADHPNSGRCQDHFPQQRGF